MSLRSDFAQLLGSGKAFLSTRASIASLEWQQAQARWRRIMVSLLIVALLLFSVWLLCHVALIAYVWDTPYRYVVLGGLVVIYTIVAMALLLRALRYSRVDNFPYTVATLKQDMEYFAGGQASHTSPNGAKAAGAAEDTPPKIASETIQNTQ